jgi:hypothetical protein
MYKNSERDIGSNNDEKKSFIISLASSSSSRRAPNDDKREFKQLSTLQFVCSVAFESFEVGR